MKLVKTARENAPKKTLKDLEVLPVARLAEALDLM